MSAHRGRQGLGAAGGLVNTGGCVSAPPGRSHTGGGRPSSSTQGMTVPFCLLLPSGIWGAIEIIYQLMWADGLIKQNRKALAAGSECVTDSGRGTLGVSCQMCLSLALRRVSRLVPRCRGAGCLWGELRGNSGS